MRSLQGVDLLVLVNIHVLVNYMPIFLEDFLQQREMEVSIVIRLRVQHSHKLERVIKLFKVDQSQGVKVRFYHLLE